MTRRYIDADLPCVSDDRPTRAELAAERDGEKYDEGFRDGEDAGYEKGHRDGMADMHDAVVSKIDELMTYHYPNGVIHQGLAIARARIAEAAPDDAEVAGPSEIKVATEWPTPPSHHVGGEVPVRCRICDAGGGR